MGLMDFLQPFAKGYIGARVEQMEALAKEKAEQRKFEDQLKATEASNIRQYTAQVRVQDESDAKKLLASSKLIKSNLLDEGMPAQFLDLIPSRHLESVDTYNAFVTSDYGGDNNWWKQPVNMPDGTEGTFADFTILANKNAKKETNLTSQGGVLEGQSNVAGALLEEDKKEEPKFADFTNFIAEPEKVVEQTIAQPEIDNFIPDVSQPSFIGIGSPTDYFQGYDPADEEDLRQRDNDILKAIQPIGNFGDGLKMVNGQPVISAFEDETESLRFNAITQIATNSANNFYMEKGYSMSPVDAANDAKMKQDLIQEMAKSHTSNAIDANSYPELQQAVDLGAITMAEALQIQLYEDHKFLAEQDIGYAGKLYYKTLTTNTQLPNGISPIPQKPEGYDTVADRVDEAIIGREYDEQFGETTAMETGLEEAGFDMDGNIIVKKPVPKKQSSDSWIKQNTVETAKEIGLDNWNKKYRTVEGEGMLGGITSDYDSKTGLKKFVNPDLPANHVEPRPGGALFSPEWDRLWSKTHNEDGTPK